MNSIWLWQRSYKVNVFSYHSDNLTKYQSSKDSAQTHWTHKPVNSKYSHCHCVDNVLTQCREAKIVVLTQCILDKSLCTQLKFYWLRKYCVQRALIFCVHTYFPWQAHVSIPISVEKFSFQMRVRSMHIVSRNDGQIWKAAFKNQEFFSQTDTGSYCKGAVVTSLCLVLKLIMMLLCICEIQSQA